MKFKTKEQEKRYSDMKAFWEVLILNQEGCKIFWREEVGAELELAGIFSIKDDGMLMCDNTVYVGFEYEESTADSETYDCVYVRYTPKRFRLLFQPQVVVNTVLL